MSVVVFVRLALLIKTAFLAVLLVFFLLQNTVFLCILFLLELIKHFLSNLCFLVDELLFGFLFLIIVVILFLGILLVGVSELFSILPVALCLFLILLSLFLLLLFLLLLELLGII